MRKTPQGEYIVSAADMDLLIRALAEHSYLKATILDDGKYDSDQVHKQEIQAELEHAKQIILTKEEVDKYGNQEETAKAQDTPV